MNTEKKFQKLFLIPKGDFHRIGIVLTLLLASPNSLASELEVRVGKTVEITCSYPYCWYPEIHQFPTGEILATIRMNPDEWHPEGAFSTYCISQDGGLTWSHRYTMGAGASCDGAYTREPPKDGGIWQLWNWLKPYPAGQAKQFRTTLTKYARHGMETQQIRDVIIRLSEPVGMAPTRMHGFGKLEDASKLEKVPNVWTFGSILKAARAFVEVRKK